MPKQILQDFRALFLLEFTKKLIENSQTEEVYKLDEVLKGEKRQEQERKEEEKGYFLSQFAQRISLINR